MKGFVCLPSTLHEQGKEKDEAIEAIAQEAASKLEP